MSAQTSRYDSDILPAQTVDVVVIGGGAAGRPAPRAWAG